MQRRRSLLFFVASAVWLVVPVVAAAQGLVPCGTEATGGALSCNLCHVGQLMQNIINFLIGISISVAAAMFAYAGFLYVTGASNPTKIASAHKIFRNVLIGFLIAISAWLVVQTILSVVFDDTFWIGGNWNELQCISQSTRNPEGGGRLIGTNFGDLINKIIPSTPPPVSLCPDGYTYDSSLGYCQKIVDGIVDIVSRQTIPTGAGTRGYAQCPAGNPNCSAATLRAAGLTLAQANAMSCIAITENSGNAVGCSGTGPCGTFQISRTNWRSYAPVGCTVADFGGNITAAQNNGECNLKTAAIMIADQGYQPWTGNLPGLPAWNPAARTCVSNYDPANL